MKISSILLSCLLIFVSCKKENKDQKVAVESKTIDFGMCFFPNAPKANSGYVIKDEKSFNLLFDSIRNKHFSCDTALIPNIDFSKYSLLGILTENVCSSKIITRSVLNDISNKQYLYNITIGKDVEPTCMMLVQTMNWVIVSKLPEDYKVVFNIIKK